MLLACTSIRSGLAHQLQEYCDEGAEDWEEERDEVLEDLRNGRLQIMTGYGSQVHCPCQPTKKPYDSLQALMQHVDSNSRSAHEDAESLVLHGPY